MNEKKKNQEDPLNIMWGMMDLMFWGRPNKKADSDDE